MSTDTGTGAGRSLHRLQCRWVQVLALALLGLGSAAATGQVPGEIRPGEVRGTVLAWAAGIPAAGVPVAGAAVSLRGTRHRATTAPDGRFALAGVADGTYTLQVWHRDHAPATLDRVTVRSGQVTELVVELDPAPVFLSEVVVTPSHFSLLRSQAESRLFLSREAVDHLPHMADDLYRAISWLPGTSGDDISAKFHVRGGETGEILVQLDGLEIYEPFHLKDFDSIFSVIDSEAVGGLDLLTGGFPAEYGDRMSGVIDVSTLTPTGETRTTVGASFINAGVLSKGVWGGDEGGQWLVSLRRGYLDIVMEWADPEGESSNIKPVYYDALAKLQYRLGDRAVASFNLLASWDEFDYEEYDDANTVLEEEVLAEDRSYYAWLNLRISWTQRLFSQTVLSAGHLERERNGAISYWSKSAQVSDQRSFDFFGLKQDWSCQLGDWSYLKWGFDARLLEGEYDYASSSFIREPLATGWGPPIVDRRDFQLQPDGNDIGLYLADRVKISEHLIAEVGVRWDRQSYVDDDQLSPRVNLVYTVGPRSTLRAAWGRFSQSQRIDELQVADGVTEYFPAQLAEHRLISFEQDLGHGISARIEAYRKDLSQVRPRFENLRNQLELFPEVEPDRFRIAPTGAEAKGIELLLRKRNGEGFCWWVSYVYSSVEDEIDGATVPRAWDQEHALNASLNYQWKNRWNLNLSGTYHSGWPTTEVSAELVTFPDGITRIVPSYGPYNAGRYPAFHRFDARVSRNVLFDRSTLTFFAEILNLFDRENPGRVESYSYAVQDDGSVRVYPDYEHWLPMIPSFGIRWTF